MPLPVCEWESAGRQQDRAVPAEVATAISAALLAYFQEEPQQATEPDAAWGMAFRREAIGEGPFTTRADLIRW